MCSNLANVQRQLAVRVYANSGMCCHLANACKTKENCTQIKAFIYTIFILHRWLCSTLTQGPLYPGSCAVLQYLLKVLLSFLLFVIGSWLTDCIPRTRASIARLSLRVSLQLAPHSIKVDFFSHSLTSSSNL